MARTTTLMAILIVRIPTAHLPVLVRVQPLTVVLLVTNGSALLLRISVQVIAITAMAQEMSLTASLMMGSA